MDTPPLLRRVSAQLDGPYPRLPRPLDALSEGWARLRPRARLLVGALAVLVVASAVPARIEREERRWGGAPVQVLVAAEDLPVGATHLTVRPAEYPPAAVPAGAVDDLPEGASLALALPEGSVLTAAHLDPRGPAAGLAEGFRAVPVPVEESWGIVGGGRVDVWVLGAEGQPARQVASAVPVLEVAEGGTGQTALVGLSEEDVGPTTEGLAAGRVLLTHVPG